MLYTESEKTFWKYHSMDCGYHGEFKIKQVFPNHPITFECPKCGSEYRPEQEYEGKVLIFAGDSIEMFTRCSDTDLIKELEKRGYRIEKKPEGWWMK